MSKIKWSDTWSLPYKLASGKAKSGNNIIESISFKDEQGRQAVTSSIEQTAQVILDNFIKCDDPEQENAEQAMMKYQMAIKLEDNS